MDDPPSNPPPSIQGPVDEATTQPSKKIRQSLASNFTSDAVIYHQMRERVTSVEHTKEACKNSGIGKSTFYDRRFIIELMEADHDAFTSLYQEERRKAATLVYIYMISE